MEHTYICKLCGAREAWDNEYAMKAAGLWHLADEHPVEYKEASGYDQPKSPRPEQLGQMFEDWELQS